MLVAAVLLAVLVGTLAQSVSGIGFSLVCGPLLVAALGPQDGVRLAVLLSLVLNVVLLARLWRQVDVRTTLLLLVPAAATTPVFATFVRTSSPSDRRWSATSLAVRTSELPSSGWAWMSRRRSINPPSSACT